MPLELKHRPTWLEIDLHAFAKNLKYIKQLADQKEVWAVVKADCYHHGLKALFSSFIEQDIYTFCVSQFDEAMYLQQIADRVQQKIKILILGDVDHQLLGGIPHNWRITISSIEWLERCEIVTDRKLLVHIKINTGMNRRGVASKETFTELFQKLQQHDCFSVEGAYTHFATADDNMLYMNQQFSHFKEMLSGFEDELTYIHAQNSHGLVTLTDIDNYCNLVRPGAICYGLSVEDKNITPIAALYSTVIEKNNVEKDEYVSYGYTYQTKTSGILGVLPIGYADGFWRSNQASKVTVNNVEVPIVGRVCMEQCMIFSEKENDFSTGDTVEIFGKTRPISLIASFNKTIDYEIMCSMAERIPRKYIVKENKYDV